MPARRAGNETVGAGDFGDWWIPGEYSVNDHGILSVLLHRSHGSGRCKASGRLVPVFFRQAEFCIFCFSRCFSQQFSHCVKCTGHIIFGRDCAIWENMCGMLSVVGSGECILRRIEHRRRRESAWQDRFYAVCCCTWEGFIDGTEGTDYCPV